MAKFSIENTEPGARYIGDLVIDAGATLDDVELAEAEAKEAEALGLTVTKANAKAETKPA